MMRTSKHTNGLTDTHTHTLLSRNDLLSTLSLTLYITIHDNNSCTENKTTREVSSALTRRPASWPAAAAFGDQLIMMSVRRCYAYQSLSTGSTDDQRDEDNCVVGGWELFLNSPEPNEIIIMVAHNQSPNVHFKFINHKSCLDIAYLLSPLLFLFSSLVFFNISNLNGGLIQDTGSVVYNIIQNSVCAE